MNPNLSTYYWAEQMNRQRLSDQAGRAWLTKAIFAGRTATAVAKLRRTTGALLVQAPGRSLVGRHLAGDHPECDRFLNRVDDEEGRTMLVSHLDTVSLVRQMDRLDLLSDAVEARRAAEYRAVPVRSAARTATVRQRLGLALVAVGRPLSGAVARGLAGTTSVKSGVSS
jgi:hypothetical protein